VAAAAAAPPAHKVSFIGKISLKKLEARDTRTIQGAATMMCQRNKGHLIQTPTMANYSATTTIIIIIIIKELSI